MARALPRRAASRRASCASAAGSAATATATPSSPSPATEEALRAHHELALRLLRRGIERLHGHLSTTERIGVRPELLASLERDAARVPGARRGDADERYRHQPYRQKLRYVYRRLGAMLEASGAALARRPRAAPGRLPRRGGARGRPAPAAGEPARRTAASGSPTAGSARSCGRPRSSASTSRASTCARHSARHTSALAEVLARYGLAAGVSRTLAEEARARVLTDEILARPAVRAAPARLQPRDERDARALPPRAPRPRARRPARDREPTSSA